MKYYIQKSIPERLNQAEEAIIIGQTSPELSDVLERQGYGAEEFADGYRRFEAARAADALRRDQMSRQVVATAEMNERYRILRLSLNTDRRMARLALRGQADHLNVLRLHIRVSHNRGDFLLQARYFYENVRENEDVLAALTALYNLTVEIFDARLAVVEKFEEALRKQQYHIGQMRAATKHRHEAMASLDAWMKRFIAVARIAFQDDVPNLQKLGIATRSRS